MDINELDDEILDSESGGTNEQPSITTSYQEEQQNDILDDLLKSKGIDDSSKITFEEDDGSIVERSWNDLTKEEKFNILNTPTQYSQNEDEIDQEEADLINQIRLSGLTPSQYMHQLQSQSNSDREEPRYKIDDLSDDEIYLLDLESRVGELTDEEAAQALASAKENQSVYSKQIEGIRKEYKEREDFENAQIQADIENQQRAAFENYQMSVIDAIDRFDSIGDLDLNFDDEDKDELARFMLSQDENGYNYFYQALQQPENQIKAAWFLLNGDEAFRSISDYFKNQIKQVSQSQYNKGFQDGKNGNSSRPNIYIDNQKNNTLTNRSYNSVNDLFDED